MENNCAVCAEPLDWVAYGKCGHRDACSACIARLRVVLQDKRCCICKQQCGFVFVTKALGDSVVSDFSSFPWFDAKIGAYFDDEDEFKRITTMYKLQCKLCETMDAGIGKVPKGFVFVNLKALETHLRSCHKRKMCELCLEGRKVFVQEQKVYTVRQLELHYKGESQVDGVRNGFSGHPMCEFCNRRFYSKDEHCRHMSTEHFTCHICERANTTQVHYYKDYDALEGHFEDKHVLCKHPNCVANKFIVFSSEVELEAHNVKEHGRTSSHIFADEMERCQPSLARRVSAKPSETGGMGGCKRPRSEQESFEESFLAEREGHKKSRVEQANRRTTDGNRTEGGGAQDFVYNITTQLVKWLHQQSLGPELLDKLAASISCMSQSARAAEVEALEARNRELSAEVTRFQDRFQMMERLWRADTR